MLKSKSTALLVLAILFAFVSGSFAKEFPGDRAGRKADYLYKKLSLTNDQYTKVYQTLLAFETKMVDKNKADRTASETSVLNDIEKILNKDQVAKFAPMKDKFFRMSYKKKVRKVKKETTEGTEKKEEKKDVKKEEKKDVKKEVKKEEKKDVKKDVKKEEKKDDKKK